jgi:hypothetical protein
LGLKEKKMQPLIFQNKTLGDDTKRIDAVLSDYDNVVSVQRDLFRAGASGNPSKWMKTSEELYQRLGLYQGNIQWHTTFASSLPYIESIESSDLMPYVYKYMVDNMNADSKFGNKGMRTIAEKIHFDLYLYGNAVVVAKGGKPQDVILKVPSSSGKVRNKKIKIALPTLHFPNPQYLTVKVDPQTGEVTYEYSGRSDYDKYLASLLESKQTYVMHYYNALYKNEGMGYPQFMGSFNDCGKLERMQYYDRAILDNAYSKVTIFYPEAMRHADGRIVTANPNFVNKLTALVGAKKKTNMMTSPYPVGKVEATYGKDEMLTRDQVEMASELCSAGWGIPSVLLLGKGSTRDEVVVRSFIEKCNKKAESHTTPFLIDLLGSIILKNPKLSRYSTDNLKFRYPRINLFQNDLNLYKAGLIDIHTMLSRSGYVYEDVLDNKVVETDDIDMFAPIDVNFSGREKKDA